MLPLVHSLELSLPLAWLLTLEMFLIFALSRNFSLVMNFYGLLSNNKVRPKYKPDFKKKNQLISKTGAGIFYNVNFLQN